MSRMKRIFYSLSKDREYKRKYPDLYRMCEETSIQMQKKAWPSVFRRVKAQGLHPQYLGINKRNGDLLFKTNSGTTPGKFWYQTIRFKDLQDGLRILYNDPTYSRKDIIELLATGDLLVYCDDPSFRYYWAYKAFISGYGINKELRAPKRNNLGLTGTTCFTGDTLVLTESGYKKIKDIAIGDKVYSHTGRLCRVTNAFSRVANVVSVQINGEEFKVTENHPFLVSEGIDSKNKNLDRYKPHWKQVKNLDNNCYALTPLLSNKGNIRVNKAYAFMLGLYLSGGYIHKGNLDWCGKISFDYPVKCVEPSSWLAIPYNHDYRDAFICLFDSLSISFDTEDFRSDKKDACFYFSDFDLMDFIADYSNQAHKDGSKTLDSRVLDWDKESKKYLLMGFYCGSGVTVRNDESFYISLFSTDKQVMERLNLIAKEFFYSEFSCNNDETLKEVYFIRITGDDLIKFFTWYRDLIIADGIQDRDLFTLNNKDVVSGYRRSVIKLADNMCEERVYNITVDNDESYLIGRGCYAVHNCKHLLAVLRVLPFYYTRIVKDYTNAGFLPTNWKKQR